MAKGRITGIGGIFFQCDDPKAMREWYTEHFGLKTDEYGALFESPAVEHHVEGFRPLQAEQKPFYDQL